MAIPTINTRLLTRGPLKVRIVNVKSPTFFWVQIENGAENFEEFLETLAQRMNKKSHFLHRPDTIQLGDLVAIREGKFWQRGIVIQIDNGDIVMVFLCDWGRTIRRKLFDCYILQEEFHEQPWEAIPCGLANTQPIGIIGRWPRRVNKLIHGYSLKGGVHGCESVHHTTTSLLP